MDFGLFFAELKLFGVVDNCRLVAETLLKDDLIVRGLEFDGVLAFDAVLVTCPDDFDVEGETGADG